MDGLNIALIVIGAIAAGMTFARIVSGRSEGPGGQATGRSSLRRELMQMPATPR